MAAPAHDQTVEVTIEEDLTRNRLTVGFRALLAIPQFIVIWFLSIAAAVLMVIGWFAALFTGRLPEPIARYLSHWIRYYLRLNAYFWMLTDRYPPFGFEDHDHPVQARLSPGTLNRLAVLFRIFLAIPGAILAGLAGSGLGVAGFVVWLINLIMGRTPRPLFEAIACVWRYGTRFLAYFGMVSSAYPWGLWGDPIPVGSATYGPHPRSLPWAISSGAKAIVVVFLVLGALGESFNGTANSQRGGPPREHATYYGAPAGPVSSPGR